MQKENKKSAPQEAKEPAEKTLPPSKQEDTETSLTKDVSDVDMNSDDVPSDPEMDSNVGEEQDQEKEEASSDGDLFQDAFEQQRKKVLQESQNRFDALPHKLQVGMVAFEKGVLDSIPDDLSVCPDCMMLLLWGLLAKSLSEMACSSVSTGSQAGPEALRGVTHERGALHHGHCG